MNKYIVVAVFSFFFIVNGFSQKSPSEYSFVVIPDQYEFQFEKDQYQLNSLTKFLFNKHGFNAFFNTELPNVDRCDGLWAEVISEQGFIWTKMHIILRDCKGNEVFKSFEGRSKLKVYSKAYQEGLRRAFESIEALRVKQKELVTFDVSADTSGTAEPNTNNRSESEIKISEEISTEAIDINDTVYENNGAQFVLKSAKNGYILFEKTADGLKNKGSFMMKSGNVMLFTDEAGNEFPSYFNANKNLVIETSFQKLLFTAVN